MSFRRRHRRHIQRRRDKYIDSKAIDDFIDTYGSPEFGPVTIVIAAYNEEKNIGSVIKSMPPSICGLDVSLLVVVDGGDDGTAGIARRSDCFTIIRSVNLGQGAALKLGYFVARKYGAKYIITADADGQTDPKDFDVVLEPLVSGEADFVNGSRRLGTTHSTGLMRNVGIVIFSKLATVLTGVKVTDTANPVRAMNAQLTAKLKLNESQFQAPEVLLSAIMSGARYVERPVTVHARLSGKSKKGSNFAYGYNYGKVFIRTWWRERHNS